MGFQRMGGDPGVVAPDLRQQLFARHRLGPGAIEILQDVGFLFRQPDLLALVVHHQLGGRAELIGADLEDGVLGLFMAAQVGADARQQDGEPERLGDIVIGAGIEAQNGVGVRRLRRQHDDRGRNPGLADQATGLAAVHVWKVDVQQDEVGARLLGLTHPIGRRRGLSRAEFLVKRQLLGQGLAQVVVVVDDQNGLGRAHGLFRMARLGPNAKGAGQDIAS